MGLSKFDLTLVPLSIWIHMRVMLKQEAHGPHRSPEQQFLVTLHFVAYAFSILNIEPLSGDPVMVRGLWLA